MATPQLEACRFRSRRSALFRTVKIPDSSEASGPDPIRADSPTLGRKNKKARQILADLSGYLAKPDQRHWCSGENHGQNFTVPPQLPEN